MPIRWMPDITGLLSTTAPCWSRCRWSPIGTAGFCRSPRWPRCAHARGARVFVDAYQAVGVLPVNVDELGCDYLVAGTCKYLLGLPGVAFLYVRDGVADGWIRR